MKSTRSFILAFTVTVFVCLGAIFLPEFFAKQQDLTLSHLSYSETVSTADTQIYFDLTTAQRLNIFLQSFSADSEGYLFGYDLSPRENEIQHDQYLNACMEELNLLADSVGVPRLEDHYILSEFGGGYVGISNWKNPQDRLSLWVVDLFFIPIDSKGSPTSTISLHCTMDAETGTIYQLIFYNIFNYASNTESDTTAFDLVKQANFPAVYADYLGFSLEQIISQENNGSITVQFVLSSSDEESFYYQTETAFTDNGPTFLFALTPFPLKS